MNTITYLGKETKFVPGAFVNTSVRLSNTCRDLLTVLVSGEWEQRAFHMLLTHFDLTDSSIIYNSFSLFFLD